MTHFFIILQFFSLFCLVLDLTKQVSTNSQLFVYIFQTFQATITLAEWVTVDTAMWRPILLKLYWLQEPPLCILTDLPFLGLDGSSPIKSIDEYCHNTYWLYYYNGKYIQ